jgi:hypothetical protein
VPGLTGQGATVVLFPKHLHPQTNSIPFQKPNAPSQHILTPKIGEQCRLPKKAQERNRKEEQGKEKEKKEGEALGDFSEQSPFSTVLSV